MFNAVERLPVVIEMIVAETPEARQAALDALLPLQRKDFRELFEVMAPHPVTIRLLDPPIHEFLPTSAARARHRRPQGPRREHPRHDRTGRHHEPAAHPEDERAAFDGLRRVFDPMMVEDAIEPRRRPC
jgi:pyruvate,orthophosphate dikinase